MRKNLSHLFLGFTLLLLATTCLGSPIHNALAAYKTADLENQEIPPYLTLVEYIQSTGTQYINTGYYAEPNSVFNIELEFTTKDRMYPFGAECADAISGIGDAIVLLKPWGSDVSMRFVDTYYNANEIQISISKHLNISCDVADVSLEVNGEFHRDESQYRNSKLKRTGEFPIFLFAANLAGEPYYRSRMKLYGFEILEDGHLIMSLIPVRDGEVGCLYDRVSGNIFYNQGTEEFLVGPDL